MNMRAKILPLAAVLFALSLPVQAQEKTPMPNRMFASAADVEKLVAKARAERLTSPDLGTLAYRTADAEEGMAAFSEKRKPGFRDA